MDRSRRRLQIFFSISALAAFACDSSDNTGSTTAITPDASTGQSSSGGDGGSSGSSGDGGSSDGTVGSGSHTLSITPAALDFGLVSCGTAAAAATFTVTNSGTAATNWKAKLSKAAASPFTLAPASGTLQPGEAATVTVTPAAIPAIAPTAADGFADVIAVSTDQSGATPFSIQLHQTAQGAVVAFTPTSIAFGSISLSTSSTSSVGVANTGNTPVHLTFAAPASTPFTVSPAGPTLISGGGNATVSAAFTPTALGALDGAITATTAPGEILCAPLPTLPVAGTGSNGVISIDHGSLTFGDSGLVDCGDAAPPQQIVLKNIGDGFFSWTGTLSDGSSFYTITPTTGTLAPATSQAITISPKPIPAASSVAPDFFAGTLTISTTIGGDAPHNVTLHQTARGAIITRSTGSVGFGNVAIGLTGSSQFTYTNIGNLDVTLTSSNANDVFSATTPVSIGHGSTALASASFTATNAVAYSDQATLAVQGVTPLCAALPAPLGLTGTGVLSNVAVTPTTLNFGSVPCGGPAAPTQSVRITNNGPAVNFTAGLQKQQGSPFTVSPPSGVIPAGGNVLVTVTPLVIPQIAPTSNNAFSDSLVITTDNPNDQAHFVTLNESALGAILVFSKASIAFPSTPNGTTNTTAGAFAITNNGSLSVPVTVSVTDAVNYDVTQFAPSVTAGTSLPANINFHPTSTGAKPTTVTVGSPGTLCAPLPVAMTITGTGT